MVRIKCFGVWGVVLFCSCFSHLALAEEVVGIRLWEEERLNIQKVLDEVIAKFHAAHPSIKVTRSHFKTEDLRTQFQTSAIGGGGADLVLAPNDFAGVFALMTLIQPVNEFIDQARFTETVRTSITDDQGKVWGIPVNQGNHLILYLNRSLVGQTPRTLKEMVDLAKGVTDRERMRYGLAFNILEPFWMIPFLGGYGASPLVDGKPHLDHAAMRHTLDLLHSFRYDSKIVPDDCDYSCADTLFMEGKAAMTINGDWALEKYAGKWGEDLVVAPLPRIGERWMRPMASGKYLLFHHHLTGKKLRAARQFAEFVTSPKIQAFLATRSQRLPALKLLHQNQVVTKDPLLKASLAAMEHAQPMPMRVEMRAVWDAIRPQLQEVMADRTSPAMASQIMQKSAELKIKSMGL